VATFENRSIVVSDTEGNNAVVTPAGELKVSSDLVGINGNTPQTLPGSPGQLLVAVEGPANAGTSITGNPVIMGGYDGANGQFVRVDTLGRQQVVGAAADGAAVAGNPVLMGGQDGANVQSLLTDTSGRLQINNAQWLGSTAPTVGQKTSANSIPVTLASDQPAIPVSSTPSASTASAVTQVAGSLVVVTLQAANAARKGLTLYNEGNQPWYVKLGAAATLTSFTVKILRDGYYEVPFGFTGIVTGIQAVSSSSLYVSELT